MQSGQSLNLNFFHLAEEAEGNNGKKVQPQTAKQ